MFAFTTERSYAQEADAADLLAGYKKEFHFPKKGEQDVIYFCGN